MCCCSSSVFSTCSSFVFVSAAWLRPAGADPSTSGMTSFVTACVPAANSTSVPAHCALLLLWTGFWILLPCQRSLLADSAFRAAVWLKVTHLGTWSTKLVASVVFPRPSSEWTAVTLLRCLQRQNKSRLLYSNLWLCLQKSIVISRIVSLRFKGGEFSIAEGPVVKTHSWAVTSAVELLWLRSPPLS